MPLFGVLFSGVMGGLVSFFAKFLTRKIAITSASVTALGSLTVIAIVCVHQLVNPLLSRIWATGYGTVLGLAFPPAAGICLTALAGGWACTILFKWQLRALMIAVQA